MVDRQWTAICYQQTFVPEHEEYCDPGRADQEA